MYMYFLHGDYRCVTNQIYTLLLVIDIHVLSTLILLYMKRLLILQCYSNFDHCTLSLLISALILTACYACEANWLQCSPQKISLRWRVSKLIFARAQNDHFQNGHSTEQDSS